NQIVYPIDHMLEAAEKILTQARAAQQQHDTALQTLRTYFYNIDNCDPTIAEIIFGVLLPYTDRLRASYDWQISMASALFTVVDTITANENQIVQGFTPGSGPGLTPGTDSSSGS
ncbi:MAG: hypothetical protein ACRDHW_09670, partial [Ktedonobacteraceae bacterium]